MNLPKIIEMMRRGPDSLLFELSLPTIDLGFLVLNDKVVMPVSVVASYYQSPNNIIIRNAREEEIGVLLILKGEVVVSSNMTEYQFISAIVDSENDSELLQENFKFKKSYVVIEYFHLYEYMKEYYCSSAIWGGFLHEKQTNALALNEPHKISVSSISAKSLSAFEPIYFETAARAMIQPYAFERFLKLYHLLEVNFDYDLVNEIKNIDISQNSKRISELLWRQRREDIERLNHTFQKYCLDLDKIVEKLNCISSYLDVAERILFDYGKDENPVKDFNKFEKIAKDPSGFGFENCKQHIPSVGDSSSYKKFISRLTIYIIYRIRNSIAHYKIGEYLMNLSDEEFVLMFGEPLIKEVLYQSYK